MDVGGINDALNIQNGTLRENRATHLKIDFQLNHADILTKSLNLTAYAYELEDKFSTKIQEEIEKIRGFPQKHLRTLNLEDLAMYGFLEKVAENIEAFSNQLELINLYADSFGYQPLTYNGQNKYDGSVTYGHGEK